MISIETYSKPAENPEIVKLVYYSMRNKYTADSDPAGLTFKEVRSILKGLSVMAIKHEDRIVGIVRMSDVGFPMNMRLGLNNDYSYENLGMIYIAKKERGHGFASAAVEHLLTQHKNLIYVVHQSNVASNKLAEKYFTFFKTQSSFRSFEAYNVYKIEQ